MNELIDQSGGQSRDRRGRARAFFAGTTSSGSLPSSNACTPVSCGWRGSTCSGRTAWRKRRHGWPNKLDDDGCRAQSLRATGHVRFIRGKYNEALEHYDAAVKLFRRAGREVDVARTLNGALQSLISLGRYEEALASARRARLIFERHGVALGLARLDSNVGNILCRQDRFDEALALYERAYEQLSVQGEPPDVAAVLSNMALCHINLNDFEKALGDLPRRADVLRRPRDAAPRRAGRLQHRLPLLSAR